MANDDNSKKLPKELLSLISGIVKYVDETDKEQENKKGNNKKVGE